jgi:site-specific DNA-adenine methylase
LERLERLDIFDIDYKGFDVVYFDPPYKGTNKYDFEFDYDRFYDLFKSLKTDLKINAFLSEYDAPFTCVAEFEKTQLMAASVGSSKSTTKEKLYFNGTADEYRELMGREFKPFENGNGQMNLFSEDKL